MTRIRIEYAIMFVFIILIVVIVASQVLPSFVTFEAFVRGLGVGLCICGLVGYLFESFEKKEEVKV